MSGKSYIQNCGFHGAWCKVAQVDLLTDKDPGQSAEQKLGNMTEMHNNTTYWNFATW